MAGVTTQLPVIQCTLSLPLMPSPQLWCGKSCETPDQSFVLAYLAAPALTNVCPSTRGWCNA